LKAIVWTRYGPPEGLELAEVPKPAPKDDELLIRVGATTVTAGDCELRGLKVSFGLRILLRLYLGLRKPNRKILGQELAGTVEAVGRNVKRFKRGDQVFGTTGLGFGAYAEFVCLPAESRGALLAMKPANMTDEEAASIPMGGLEALRFLRRGNLHRGQAVLIIGAGGSIGVLAVQLAKYFGTEVTAVDRTEKLEMLRSVGADQVIDFLHEDVRRAGSTYDVVFDVVGKSRISENLGLVKADGVYLCANPRLSTMFRRPARLGRGGVSVVLRTTPPKTEDLVFLKALIEMGRVKSAIDRRYPLEQVPDAHRYVESGIAQGKVVITVGRPAGPNPTAFRGSSTGATTMTNSPPDWTMGC
jgi:NADPH:quinone reductase-like Zn-dependent oxidoreductase